MPVSTSTILEVAASLQLTASANIKVIVGAINVAAGTIEFDTITRSTGALVNPSSAAGNRIHWKLRQNLGGPKSISNI